MVFPTSHKYRRRTEGTSLTGGKVMGLVYAEIELINGAYLAFNRGGILPENKIRVLLGTIPLEGLDVFIDPGAGEARCQS